MINEIYQWDKSYAPVIQHEETEKYCIIPMITKLIAPFILQQVHLVCVVKPLNMIIIAGARKVIA